VGQNVDTGKEIFGTKYQFKDIIYRIHLDTTTRTLSLQIRGVTRGGKYLKNKGEFAVFDLDTKKIPWSKKVNFGNYYIEQYGSLLTFNSRTGKKTTRVDLKTGNDLWKSNVVIFATIPKLNIALGYRLKAFTWTGENPWSQNLLCIDLHTNNILWQRRIDNTYGWSNVIKIDDENIIIKSSGLHYVNLKTGDGWDYDAQTAMTSFFNEYKKFESNLLSDSLYYYYASKNQLACLSKADGKLQWKRLLPNGTSASIVVCDSLNIYLINRGEIEKNTKIENFWIPYFAAFDKMTGQSKYCIAFEENNPLIDYVAGKDTFDLFFKNRAERIDLNTGKSTAHLFDEKNGEIAGSVDNLLNYIETDNVFQNLYSIDAKSAFFLTDKKIIVQVNRDLKIVRKIENKNLYSWRGGTKEMSFLYSNNKIYVANASKELIATLNLKSRTLFEFNDKLYAIQNDALIEIDLEDI
jgi:outer membrane protein assembly factor BamB